MCCSDIHWIYVGNISDTHIVHTLVIMYLDICMCALKLSMNGSKSLQSLSCKALSSLGAPLDVPNTVYCSLFLDGAATEQYFNQYKKKRVRVTFLLMAWPQRWWCQSVNPSVHMSSTLFTISLIRDCFVVYVSDHVPVLASWYGLLLPSKMITNHTNIFILVFSDWMIMVLFV